MLKCAPRVSTQMMNIQDWVPTLFSAVGGDPSTLDPMDGMDMWSSLSDNTESPRNLMLHNIDEERLISAVRVGEWKLLKGTTYDGAWDSWYGPDGRTGRDYNITELRLSKAATALTKIGISLPSDEKIDALRKEADVSCTKPKDATPCKPMQQVGNNYGAFQKKRMNSPVSEK